MGEWWNIVILAKNQFLEAQEGLIFFLLPFPIHSHVDTLTQDKSKKIIIIKIKIIDFYVMKWL